MQVFFPPLSPFVLNIVLENYPDTHTMICNGFYSMLPGKQQFECYYEMRQSYWIQFVDLRHDYRNPRGITEKSYRIINYAYTGDKTINGKTLPVFQIEIE